MSAGKAALKAAKACLDKKDWTGAEQQAQKVLSFEPDNLFATLFLGKSFFEQKKYAECESTFRQAATIDAEERQRKTKKPDATILKGLTQLYEAWGKVDEYMDALTRQATVYMELDDRDRCCELFNKLHDFVKRHGTKAQEKRMLQYFLPGTPLYDYLDGLVQRPDKTYRDWAEIVEVEETERMNKEIANRRSRLGAVLGQVTTDVKREILSQSPLEELYQHILNWSDDEEVRRETDRKLLEHAYEKLVVLPKEHKLGQRVKVENWARGLVILKYPLELAWRIVLEWKDCESLLEHDVILLREFIQFFPENGLAMSLKAFLGSEISPFPPSSPLEGGESKHDEKTAEAAEESDEDDRSMTRLRSMVEGVRKSPKSVICHRILGDYQLFLEEFENAVETCRKSRVLVAGELQQTGLSLMKTQDAVTVTLATSLIHYQAPKHHLEAKAFFESVLKRNSAYGGALVGLGLILEEQEDYGSAHELLQKALERDPDSTSIRAEAAWCLVMKGDYQEGRLELEECLKSTGVDARSRHLKAQIFWRIGMALWNSDEEARSDREGPYLYFVKALQSDQNFAPAYSNLGFFFSDIVGDSNRATKCFQKAFELSPGEVQAAERLARSFAETKDWELVEIVARRVLDAEKVRALPGQGASWPHTAAGVVELGNQNFPMAITHFQTALRASPNDYNSWIGLGEAYASSGRFTAATKVFSRAEKLDSTNWFAKYMLANVNRELGEFEDACAGYRAVLQLREKEFGVLVALSETLTAAAWDYLEKGFYWRAVDNANEGLAVAEVILQERPDAFNLWKTVGDACSIFSWVQSQVDRLPKDLVLRILETDIEPNEYDIMADVDEVGHDALQRLKKDDIDATMASTWMAILAHKRAIVASAEDRHAHAVAWFNLGCAEYRAYSSLPKRDMKYRLAAIRSFKRTIKLEPGNHEFWNALGVATAELNPSVAQHALVRALYINDKNARVWTNLGAFYFTQEDDELANKAFSRAQSADPEYALAWVGQGLIASRQEPIEAQQLFEHAFEISDQSLTSAKGSFASATFNTLITTQAHTSLLTLIPPIFALEKLQSQVANQPAVLRLRALYDERVGAFASALDKLESVCSFFEERYEESESEADLIKFAQSKADVARVHLGIGNYDEAIENASMALDLSGEVENLMICRLSAHLTSGLANYYNGDMDDSLEMFKTALTESNDNPDVVCLLSQVLWAKGGKDERDVAREQLYSSIEAHPHHLQSILLLGAIGVFDEDAEVAEIVVDELRTFRANESLPPSVRESIDNLLTAIAKLSSGDEGNEEAIVALTSVFLRPGLPAAWARLAGAAQLDFAGEMALKVAEKAKGVEAYELAKAYGGVGKVGCDLRAIYLAPWRQDGWKALQADLESFRD